MAIIGLLDWDLIRWHSATVFNLELMKLASYHKIKKHDIVQMLPRFSSDKVTKVFIQKDYEDFLYPDIIMNDPKVTWRGLALSDNYVPMDLDIEQCKADTSIYRNLSRYYKMNGTVSQAYKNMMKAIHARLTFDGKNLFDGWEKQFPNPEDGKVRHIILHDKNLIGNQSLYELVQVLFVKYGRKNVRLGFKFPLEIYTVDQFLTWGRVSKVNELSNLKVYNIMPNDFIRAISEYKQQITYAITESFFTADTFIQSLPQIFMQGLFLSKTGVTLLLKLDENFPVKEQWIKVIDIMNRYFANCVKYRNELLFCAFTYCKFMCFDLTREEKIELFKFVREENEDLFELFYRAEYIEYDKGKLIPKLYTHQEIKKGGGYGSFYYQRTHQTRDGQEMYNYADIVQSGSVYLE